MRQRLATLICSLLAVPLVWAIAPASASAAPPAPACDNTTRTAVNGDTVIRPSYGAETGNFNCTLGPGAGGSPSAAAAVKALQWSLGVPIDGTYGPQVRYAVMRIETRNRLPVDRIYDVDVCSVMYWRSLGGRAYLLPCR